jgi:hypothetical protein
MQTTQPAIEKQAKRKILPARAVGLTLLGIGAIALTVSIIYVSSILAFVGLGLVFWGIIVTYIQTEEYVKETLLQATVLSSLATLDQMTQEMNCTGKAVYLPPKYFTDPEASKVYVPKQKDGKLPTPEQIQNQETRFLIENPQGILVTPPGAGLTRLFEETLGTRFTRVDLKYLQQNMPKLFIEDLEIAQNFEMQIENNKILVKIENSAYKNLTEKVEKLSNVYSLLGCPVSSAIACALAKATGKPIIIENQRTSEDGIKMEIEYRVLEEEQTEK